MSTPLIYVEQSILGLLVHGQMPLPSSNKVQWVYSNEHFAEIRRSPDPAKYLAVLDSLRAKLLDLQLDHKFRITGSATLTEGLTARDQYSRYCKAVDEVSSADDIFDPVLAWVNGGGTEQHLRNLPKNIAEQLLRLIEDVPHDQRAELQEKAQDLNFNDMIDQMVAWGNDIEKTRQAFGASKGRIGQIKGPNQLDTIWGLISPALGGITSDQFFGFDPFDKQDYDSWPTYLGIVGCCAVLDIIGFQAEKKTRKLAKMPGVRSDAQHIAMGAFCSAILTADRRLARRAKAIYEYKNIRTIALVAQLANSKLA